MLASAKNYRKTESSDRLEHSQGGKNWKLVVAALAWIAVANSATAQDAKSIALDAGVWERSDGFFDFYWDHAQGKIWLGVERLEEPFLYASSLASGLGSNPVGLDRGQLGESRVVRFKRVGKQLYLIQHNLKYRASSDNVAEQTAVRDSFAESILWSGEVKSTATDLQVVDLSSFLLRDAHDCSGRLAAAGQGSYALDAARSYLHRERSQAFPRNTEFEAVLTFASAKPGALAEGAAADGKSLTLRQHHSFVQLPDDAYQPRRFDPRVGCFSLDYSDYSVAIDQPIEQRLITRHRLQKQDPNAQRSLPIKPIIYYVDPGVPQPIREALIEGASWWSEAFEAAGFVDAFQVKLLPEGADPMDVRYNMIQWVHRATRGWSYGQSVIDPRTGEILKGHVLLGSLRVRQDHLLFEGLTSSLPIEMRGAAACSFGASPSPAYLAQVSGGADSTQLSLARIRQLSAHEVGHTLGFAHNFAASTYGDRASVMDYPAPRVKVVNNNLDLSDAYGVGIGEWDAFTVRYAYSQFTPATEQRELQKLVDEAVADQLLYITDADARPAGAAHPLANLWDNGSDPVQALDDAMQVRRLALDKFGTHVIARGQSLADLEQVFVPVYLHHRYQVEAAAKMLGGFLYTYAVHGDSQTPQREIAAEGQRRALDALLATLTPEALVIPSRIVDVLPPRAYRSVGDIERFTSQTAPVFDANYAMRAAADLTIACVLQPQRAARLARCKQPGWNLETVLSELTSRLSGVDRNDAEAAEAQRTVQAVYVERLIDLASSSQTSDDARALATAGLRQLEGVLRDKGASLGGLNAAHSLLLRQRIERFLSRADPNAAPLPAVELPPGSPIGQ